jgi:hypothetical protein
MSKQLGMHKVGHLSENTCILPWRLHEGRRGRESCLETAGVKATCVYASRVVCI